MSAPVVVVADATPTDDVTAAGTAAVEVAATAFVAGVSAAESAQWRDDDAARRVDELEREVAALRADAERAQGAAATALVVADAAAEIALDAADAVEGGPAGDGAGEGGDDAPRPPERRESDAPASDGAPADKEHTGYGASWCTGSASRSCGRPPVDGRAAVAVPVAQGEGLGTSEGPRPADHVDRAGAARGEDDGMPSGRHSGA
jgi:hypothetical protein